MKLVPKAMAAASPEPLRDCAAGRAITQPLRLAVVGQPVAHSQSPFIHSEFARQFGMVVDYQRVPAELGQFEPTLRAFAAAGAWGCNVTVPFKFELPDLCSRVSARATRASAANTVRFDADGWFCDNTDGIGLMRDLTQGAGLLLRDRRVLMLGAGGAAAGVLGPLLQECPREVVIANRSIDKATQLLDRHVDLAADRAVALRTSSLAQCADGTEHSFDLVINATATSLAGAPVPASTAVLAPGAWAVDLMYGRSAEPFLSWALQADAQARDGLGMLVEQAAAAFEIWFGQLPATAPVLTALRERLQHPLT